MRFSQTCCSQGLTILQNGTLAVSGGRQLAPLINHLLILPFKVKVASKDHHPKDHCSFASQHAGATPISSSHTIRNPEASGENVEEQTTVLWPDHCVQGTSGCELVPELDTSHIQHVVNKGEDRRVESYSAFGPPFRKPAVGMSGLYDILRDAGIKRVFVCGIAFDYCVKDTAIDAAKSGFGTFLIEDAAAAVNQSKEELASTRRELEEAGVKLISSTHDVLKTP